MKAKATELQVSFADTSEEYADFLDKFKPKKTTDDCYTPDNVYEAVLDWVVKEYGVDPSNVVRPFWPGGDYERFEYYADTVVVDNPPFSIISEIVTFYLAHDIKFFLFAPYLTNFSCGVKAAHIICPSSILYENGAMVDTAFLTNLEDEYAVRGVPELYEILTKVNKENMREQRRELPKYSYPYEVLTASAVGYMAKHGVEFKVKRRDVFFIRQLAAMKEKGKGIFGSGFLLSERAAAERAAAERAAAERAAATTWELSEDERMIVKSLGKE